MKIKLILAALVALFSFAEILPAQSLRLTFSEAIQTYTDRSNPLSTQGTWGGGKMVKIDFCKTTRDAAEALITYTGLESPNARLFEAVLPASSPEECLANRDFSSAVPVGPERALLMYDPESTSGYLRWFLRQNDSSNCRVLLVRNSADTTDLAVWRTNFGAGGYSPAVEGKGDLTDREDAAPQRSRVTSLVVTFDQVINP